jgi:2'-5' RNA ligase
LRLFIAINFKNETILKLLKLCAWLKAGSVHGRFSSPENLHLTLAFLGECNTGQAVAAQSAMNENPFSPFGISIDSVGRFKRSGGDLWWAGVREDKPLMDLQRGLSTSLAAKGFRLDERKFSPHITLGREVETTLLPKKVEPFGETVGSIELMKSERINNRQVYTQISVHFAPE